MTITELKEHALRQLGEDVEDVAEFDDLLDVYLNQGYLLMMEKRLSGDMTDVDPLGTDNNLLPERVHPALADYATYSILMNGNAAKQSRAQSFYARFMDVLQRLKSEKDEAAETANSGTWTFTGLYDY